MSRLRVRSRPGANRLRDQLRRTRQRIEAQGAASCWLRAITSGRWWQAANWLQLQRTLPGWLVDLLDPLRECILKAHQNTERLTQTVEEAAKGSQPVGLGALSSEIIDREIGDWSRFSNRRQIASYTGLCPGEHSSGASRRQGSVTKHGNPRLRHTLIETAWRLIYYQPHYRAVQRWSTVLGAPARHRRRAQEGHRRNRPATGRRSLAHPHRARGRRSPRSVPQRKPGGPDLINFCPTKLWSTVRARPVPWADFIPDPALIQIGRASSPRHADAHRACCAGKPHARIAG